MPWGGDVWTPDLKHLKLKNRWDRQLHAKNNPKDNQTVLTGSDGWALKIDQSPYYVSCLLLQ